MIQARIGSIESSAIISHILSGLLAFVLVRADASIVFELFGTSTFFVSKYIMFHTMIRTNQNINCIILTYFLFAKQGSTSHIIRGTIHKMNKAYLILNSFDFKESGSASLYSLKYIQRSKRIISQNTVLAIRIVLSFGLFFMNSMNLNIIVWLFLNALFISKLL